MESDGSTVREMRDTTSYANVDFSSGPHGASGTWTCRSTRTCTRRRYVAAEPTTRDLPTSKYLASTSPQTTLGATVPASSASVYLPALAAITRVELRTALADAQKTSATLRFFLSATSLGIILRVSTVHGDDLFPVRAAGGRRSDDRREPHPLPAGRARTDYVDINVEAGSELRSTTWATR